MELLSSLPEYLQEREATSDFLDSSRKGAELPAWPVLDRGLGWSTWETGLCPRPEPGRWLSRSSGRVVCVRIAGKLVKIQVSCLGRGLGGVQKPAV